MTFQFTIQITEKHIKYASGKFYFRILKKAFFMLGVLMALVLFMYLEARAVTGFVEVLLGILGFSAIFLFFFYFALLKQSLARFKKFGGKVDYEFTDDFCKTKSGWASTEIKWAAFQALWIYPKVWILFSRDVGYCTLPVDQISSEIRDFLTQKIISVGGKTK